MTKILVTGAEGQLGSELKEAAKDFPHFNFKFFSRNDWDITSAAQTREVINHEQPEIVINCAAYTQVDRAEAESEKAFLINEEAVKILSLIAQEEDIYVIHFSTDYVFDGKKNMPYTEQDITNPLSVYGLSKLRGEKAVLQAQVGMVIRISWLFSTYGHNFLKTMLRLGEKQDELKVVNDQIASPTYARIFARDLLSLISSREQNHLPKGLFHYSHEGIASWFDFATFIFQHEKRNVTVFPVSSDQFPTASQRPSYSKLDSTKWQTTTALPSVNWKDSVSQCLLDFKGIKK